MKSIYMGANAIVIFIDKATSAIQYYRKDDGFILPESMNYLRQRMISDLSSEMLSITNKCVSFNYQLIRLGIIVLRLIALLTIH